ncbi:MAG: hypothetical protein R2818_11815 [Flavobacteriales bacterium]
MVLRPGELSFFPGQYMTRQRVKYMRPVAFFFLANFIYFAIPVFQTFNTTLDGHMRYMPCSAWANEMVEQHLNTRASPWRMRSYTTPLPPANNAKLLLVFMVFLLALPAALLYVRKRSYISAYVTASFELMSFHVWVSTIFLGTAFGLLVLLLNTLGLNANFVDVDTYLSIPLILLHLWVTIGIGQRFFACSWGGAIWRAVAMLFGLQFALGLSLRVVRRNTLAGELSVGRSHSAVHFTKHIPLVRSFAV